MPRARAQLAVLNTSIRSEPHTFSEDHKYRFFTPNNSAEYIHCDLCLQHATATLNCSDTRTQSLSIHFCRGLAAFSTRSACATSSHRKTVVGLTISMVNYSAIGGSSSGSSDTARGRRYVPAGDWYLDEADDIAPGDDQGGA
jgi:hypothetical protein